MILLLVFLFYAIILSTFLAYSGYRSRSVPSGKASQSQPRRILIIGATGGTGRQLVTTALDRGYAVTALVRNPLKLKTDHPQLTVIQGDVLDYTSVESAMRGQDAVLSALGHKRYFGPTRILSTGTRHILQAMKTHNVSRIICETSLGIGDSAGRMGLYYTFFVIPVILPFYFWDKTRQERRLAESGVDWIIVRPGVLTSGQKRGRIRHGRHVGNFLWTVRISRSDVADFMLNQLDSDNYLRTAVGIAR